MCHTELETTQQWQTLQASLINGGSECVSLKSLANGFVPLDIVWRARVS